jgi:hypothetical protein
VRSAEHDRRDAGDGSEPVRQRRDQLVLFLRELFHLITDPAEDDEG